MYFFRKADLTEYANSSDVYDDISEPRQLNNTWQLQLYIEIGLIRVKTRIRSAVNGGFLSFLLPQKSSHLTVLIIHYYHGLVMHDHGRLALTLAIGLHIIVSW